MTDAYDDDMRFLFPVMMLTLSLLSGETNSKTRNSTRASSSTAVQPVVVFGDGWQQKFIIQNVGAYLKQDLKLTLEFYRSDGKPWSIETKDHGTVDKIPLTIPVFGLATIETALSFGPNETGWMKIVTVPYSQDEGRNYFHAQTILKRVSTDRPDSVMVAQLWTGGFSDDSVTHFDLQDGNKLDLTILNSYEPTSFTKQDTITIMLYDEDGQPFARKTKAIQRLQSVTFSLADEFPAALDRRGSIVIDGYDVSVFAILTSSTGVLSAVSSSEVF
jgi:hypothetical protein